MCANASKHGPDLGTKIVPKMRRLFEIYATPLPTVDRHTGSPYTVDIKPYPSKRVSLTVRQRTQSTSVLLHVCASFFFSFGGVALN